MSQGEFDFGSLYRAQFNMLKAVHQFQQHVVTKYFDTGFVAPFPTVAFTGVNGIYISADPYCVVVHIKDSFEDMFANYVNTYTQSMQALLRETMPHNRWMRGAPPNPAELVLTLPTFEFSNGDWKQHLAECFKMARESL